MPSPQRRRACRAGCDPANHATLACRVFCHVAAILQLRQRVPVDPRVRVSALKDYDYACARGLDPSLQTNKLDLELRKLLLEFLASGVDLDQTRFSAKSR